MRDLEFIRGSRGSPGSPGSRGSRQNDVAARCSEPPFPTRGGQDDGSYTNSLKRALSLTIHHSEDELCTRAGYWNYDARASC